MKLLHYFHCLCFIVDFDIYYEDLLTEKDIIEKIEVFHEKILELKRYSIINGEENG